jgi:hypothetical protein
MLPRVGAGPPNNAGQVRHDKIRIDNDHGIYRDQLAAQIDNFRGSQVQKSESDQWSELWNRL